MKLKRITTFLHEKDYEWVKVHGKENYLTLAGVLRKGLKLLQEAEKESK